MVIATNESSMKMARISKLALFWRAFLVSLIFGTPTAGNRAHADESGDWASAVDQGTFESFVWYLKRNPTGAHIEEALNNLVTLSKDGVAEAAGAPAASGDSGFAAASGTAAAAAAAGLGVSGASVY